MKITPEKKDQLIQTWAHGDPDLLSLGRAYAVFLDDLATLQAIIKSEGLENLQGSWKEDSEAGVTRSQWGRRKQIEQDFWDSHNSGLNYRWLLTPLQRKGLVK